MATYGHRQLTLFFFPLLETRESGFTFKGRRYVWKDVDRIDIWQERWPPVGMVVADYIPHGRITLRDGRNIRINGRAFEKKDLPLKPGYLSAFEEVVDEFRRKVSEERQAGAHTA